MDTLRFSVGPTIGGFEVVDRDGRPVSPCYEVSKLAKDVAVELNAAYAKGRKTLARALGAI
jgi:hypothetical protein